MVGSFRKPLVDFSLRSLHSRQPIPLPVSKRGVTREASLLEGWDKTEEKRGEDS